MFLCDHVFRRWVFLVSKHRCILSRTEHPFPRPAEHYLSETVQRDRQVLAHGGGPLDHPLLYALHIPSRGSSQATAVEVLVSEHPLPRFNCANWSGSFRGSVLSGTPPHLAQTHRHQTERRYTMDDLRLLGRYLEGARRGTPLQGPAFFEWGVWRLCQRRPA